MYIYLDVCTDRIIDCHVMSLPLASVTNTRLTFCNQWISVSEVLMREQGQRRLPRTDSTTLTASVCVTLYTILNMQAFHMF